MRDDTTKVYISKIDAAEKAELPGARLILRDSSGEIMMSWISDGSPRELEGRLIAGETYTLTEISAPQGYDIASDVEFTVNMDGSIQTVTMEDQVSSGRSSVIVQKLVMMQGQYTAVDYTFYVALFSDKECTERVSSVKPLYVNGSYTTQTIFTDLDYGTYYVAETDEYGNPLTPDGVFIESNEVLDGEVVLTPDNATEKSIIINHLAELPEGYLKEGKITVHKTVMVNGVKSNVKDTFYFALFVDPALTRMADADVMELSLDNASSGSVTFSGLPLGEYYLAETDENGIPVDSTYKYSVIIDASYVKLDEENLSAVRSVINSATKKPTTGTSTTTTTTTGTKITTGTKTTSGSTPKTGDDTPIAGYMLALIASAGLLLLGIRRRRKKYKNL